MTQNDIIKIFCKAFGLYFIIQVAENIRDLIMSFMSVAVTHMENDILYYPFIVYGFYLLFDSMAAWILITKADIISNRITKGPAEKIDLNLSKETSIELVIIAISGLLILQSFPEIVYKLVSYIYRDRKEKEFEGGFQAIRDNWALSIRFLNLLPV